MMRRLTNAQRAEIMRVLARARSDTKIATVTSYDPNTYAVQVTVHPEEIQSGWLPILSPWVGDNFGEYFGPIPGVQAIVLHLEGDIDSGLVTGFINSTEEVPPPVPSGEAWRVHKSGSFLKFTNDGDVSLTTNKDLVATVGGKVTATVTGDCELTISGKLVAGASEFDLTGDLHVTGQVIASGEGTFNGHTVTQHTHTQPADSHGDTEQPTNKPTG